MDHALLLGAFMDEVHCVQEAVPFFAAPFKIKTGAD
jgi:hypothetical protein